MADTPTYKYDVFLSYSHRDGEWVRGQLLPRLREAGLKVIYDDLFELGVASVINMERAVEDSRCTLVVLTPSWVKSQWTEFEELLTTTKDPSGRRKRLIPLRLEPCDPPSRIAMLTHIDLTRPEERETRMQRLLASLTGGGALPSEPARGEPVRRGLEALTELLKENEVRGAVAAFSFHFKEASRQIEILSSYKDLHDLLHTLQQKCYEPIVEEASQLPDNKKSWENLLIHESRLQGYLDDLGELAGRMSLKDEASDILDELSAAAEILSQAVASSDTQKLAKAIWEIDQVLAFRPTVIDAQLNATAKALNLSGLAASMRTVCSKLRELNVRPEQVHELETGVAALERLAESLTTLVDHHGRWQRVEQELRRIAGNLASSLEELKSSWPRLKRRIEPLYASSDERWALLLKANGENLERCLAEQEANSIECQFKMYRGRADQRFFTIDKNLKEQCRELSNTSKPLDMVMRILG